MAFGLRREIADQEGDQMPPTTGTRITNAPHGRRAGEDVGVVAIRRGGR